MIILDKPFVSDLLKDTLVRNQFKVLRSQFTDELQLPAQAQMIDAERAIIEYNAQWHPQIYSNSENAINWITKNLYNTPLPEKINLFKDKVRFRKLLSDLYPNFYYRELNFEEIKDLEVTDIPKPFIIKPSVGFFSMGVYKVVSDEDWKKVPQLIFDEMEQIKNLYPADVMNAGTFIIEEMIEGDEFAFDVYFNREREPVVLGIYKHLFSSDNDVSDRVYYSSKEIIETHLQNFTHFSKQIGDRADLINFPMHVEVRVDSLGNIVPIEVNPMRFGGWCTTADLTTFAYDLNPYEYYFNQQKPNWEVLLKEKADLHYCLIILDNTTGYEASEIAAFDFDRVLKKFHKPLELRRSDWNAYPVFGMLFTETHVDNYSEIESILKSDLKEFVTLKQNKA